MNKKIQYVSFTLVLLGLLPFFALGLLPHLKTNYANDNIQFLVRVLTTYILVINCFMAGTLWGSFINRVENTKLSISAILYSNVSVLLSLFVYFFCSAKLFSLLIIPFFIFNLYFDDQLYKSKHIAKQYFMLRIAVTSIAVAFLLIFFLGSC